MTTMQWTRWMQRIEVAKSILAAVAIVAVAAGCTVQVMLAIAAL